MLFVYSALFGSAQMAHRCSCRLLKRLCHTHFSRLCPWYIFFFVCFSPSGRCCHTHRYSIRRLCKISDDDVTTWPDEKPCDCRRARPKGCEKGHRTLMYMHYTRTRCNDSQKGRKPGKRSTHARARARNQHPCKCPAIESSPFRLVPVRMKISSIGLTVSGFRVSLCDEGMRVSQQSDQCNYINSPCSESGVCTPFDVPTLRCPLGPRRNNHQKETTTTQKRKRRKNSAGFFYHGGPS